MAHTTPEVDTNQVPERPGALGLPEKDPRPDLRHRPFMQPLDGCVRRGPEWPQPELRRFIVKQPDQQEQKGAAHQARSPKCPGQTDSGRTAHETRGMATTVPRPCTACRMPIATPRWVLNQTATPATSGT